MKHVLMRNVFKGYVLTRLLFLFVFFLLTSTIFTQNLIRKSLGAKNEQSLFLNNLKQVARLTGNPLKGENFPSPNNTAENFDVGGTDLGILWEMNRSQVGIFFGDTNGKNFVAGKGGGNGSNWRSNVLAFSKDTNLEDGLVFESMALDSAGAAREICAGAKSNPEKYQTSIPTAAIRVAGIDYVHYMNIYEWAGKNGRWLTNFSSIYASYDGGNTWTRKKEITFKSDSKFSQICYAKKDGFVFMIGTLAGRGSSAYLARFKEADMLKLDHYEYWNGVTKKWVKNQEEAATAIIEGPVGEASLLFHKKYKRWIIAYSYDGAYEATNKKKFHAIVYRDAKQLNSNWSNMKILATDKEYPGLYSPYLHPGINDSDKVYFTMSLWKPYNVFLMKADIELH
jgi:hypothetical protein